MPAGWIGDRFGPKKIITVAILWWSFFTIATAFAADIPWSAGWGLLALAAGFNLFATPIFWATCNDLSPHASGSLSGLMNMGGNIGGWLSPILTAAIAVRFGWQNALYFGSLMTLVAGSLWFFIGIQER